MLRKRIVAFGNNKEGEEGQNRLLSTSLFIIIEDNLKGVVVNSVSRPSSRVTKRSEKEGV